MSKTDFYQLIRPFVTAALKLLIAAEKQGITSFETDYANVRIDYKRETRTVVISLKEV